MTVPTMLTIPETAKRTGLPVYYIRTLVRENKIVHVRAGAKALINLERLCDYLNEPPQEEPIAQERIGILEPLPVKINKLRSGRV